MKGCGRELNVYEWIALRLLLVSVLEDDAAINRITSARFVDAGK